MLNPQRRLDIEKMESELRNPEELHEQAVKAAAWLTENYTLMHVEYLKNVDLWRIPPGYDVCRKGLYRTDEELIAEAKALGWSGE